MSEMSNSRPRSSQSPVPPDASGDRLGPEEFGARFRESAAVLWCVAASIVRNRSQVEDVLQESAVIALSKLGQFEPETNFTAWMSQIVRYVALNQSRRRIRRRTTPTDPEIIDQTAARSDRSRPVDVSHDGRLHTDQHDFDDRVAAVLDDLSEMQRACILLRTVLELPYAEIARALDLPEGTAMSHVYRARQIMRRKLSRDSERSPSTGDARHE